MRSGHQFEEDEWDLNKKNYLKEIRKSNRDKKVIGIMTICLAGILIFTILGN